MLRRSDEPVVATGGLHLRGVTVMTEGDADLDQHIARVVDALTETFRSTHDRQAVEQAVVDARALLETDARITKYLPVLVTRRAINHLAGRPSASPTAQIRPARYVPLAKEVLRPVVRASE